MKTIVIIFALVAGLILSVFFGAIAAVNEDADRLADDQEQKEYLDKWVQEKKSSHKN